ncbi:MAG: cyclic nucleotide-binding domain-containing protein, partial [Rhodospirillaceae bacterium]|nr:cyclic nucleotide-binding domain-containing protein [Rhodospirillaceae bacterium]
MSQEEESLREVGRRGLRHLFPSLDEEGRALWEARMSWRNLAKGEVLFREGDPSEALYVMLQGRLVAVAKNERREEIVVAVIGPAETVGENGLISSDPRNLTIRALTDSKLFRLSKDDIVVRDLVDGSALGDAA